VAIAAGGTGGHVFAAVAAAEAFLRHGVEPFIMYPAADRAWKFLDEEGAAERFNILELPGFNRAGFPGSIPDVLRQARAAMKIFDERRPSALLVVGGYSVAAPGIAAISRRIPVFVYEQNAVAGTANRMFSYFAKTVLANIPAQRISLPQLVVGHPVRRRLLDAAASNPPPQTGLRRILIIGGSQGARAIDETMMELYPLIRRRFPAWRIMHLAGPDLADKASAAYRSVWSDPENPDGVYAFRKDMETLYPCADAAVSRAGAAAAAELALFGTAVLFVPYPFAAAQHQHANAAYFAGRGAAGLVSEGPGFRERLWGALSSLLSDDAARSRMQQAFRSLSPANDGAPLVQAVLSAVGKRGAS